MTTPAQPFIDENDAEWCGEPCHPSMACDQCAEYWDRMRSGGYWKDGEGWTNKGWQQILRDVK